MKELPDPQEVAMDFFLENEEDVRKSGSYGRLGGSEGIKDEILKACFRGLKRKRDE